MDILNFTGELARMQQGGGGNMNITVSGDQAASMGIIPVAGTVVSIRPGAGSEL
ncbi:MAG: hypothetical protein IPQ06_14130 [Chitinophagaceae bacterium]|nr:hypothetical protein [Chitinophagaceae bacterium]